MAIDGPFATFRPEVKRALPLMIVVRFLGNTGFRLGYSFLRAFSNGSGLSIQQLGTVLAFRDLLGLGAPVAGRVSDRLGPTRVMLFGGWAAVAGLFIMALGRTGLVVGLLIFGLGRLAYDIPMNAWVSERVAYARRGKALGLVEVSWATAALIGIPVSGLLIDGISWRAAPIGLAIATMPVLWAVGRRVDPVLERNDSPRVKPTFTVSTVMALIALSCLTFCSQMLFVGHGLWLGDTYGFNAAGIGFAVLTIGAVELIASTSSAAFADRLGKRTAMIGGTAVMLVGMGALSWDDGPPLALGLLMLAIAFIGFEFGFVSALPLISELDPAARAQIIGLGLGISTAARAVGGFFGVPLYEAAGFSGLMIAGLVVGSVGIVIMVFGVIEPVNTEADQELVN